jgi:thiamine-monophosphate kinase
MDVQSPPAPGADFSGAGPQAPVPPRPASRLCRWRDPAGEKPASEADCLALIDALFPERSAHVPHGRGDDCALLADVPAAMLLSTDMFWEDVHFRTSYFTPEEAGGKALAAAVSDLAAAAAAPLGFSLALMLPDWIGCAALRAVLAGMAAGAREYGVTLSGGDLSRGEKLGFSLTVWGASPFDGTAALRRGLAKPGDVIFLVGEAGLAGAGLWALELSGRGALEEWPQACLAHLAPRPLLAEGQALARLARETPGQTHRLAVMDLSDGLARDLPRLLGGPGADLSFDEALIPREVRSVAARMGQSPEALFLTGGEDYALIGTCAAPFWHCLERAVPGARPLGRVGERPGLRLDGQPLALEGFDHFAGGAARDAAHADEPARAHARAASRAAPPPASPPPFAEEKSELIRLGREAWEAGLMAGFNGNVSCRVRLDGRLLPGADAGGPQGAAAGEACLITRAGTAKGRLTEDDFALLCPGSGKTLAGASPSTESVLHLAVYAACPQSRVVLHAHPPFLTALSLILEPDKRLVLPLPEAESYRARLGHISFHPPGSAALAEATAAAARASAAVWMERHGLVTHAENPRHALALAEELEQLAKIHLALLGCFPGADGARAANRR